MQQRLIKGGLGLVNLSMCRGTTASATQNKEGAPDLVAHFEEESSDSELMTAESAHSPASGKREDPDFDDNGCRIQKHLPSASARRAASVNPVAASVRWVPVRHQ